MSILGNTALPLQQEQALGAVGYFRVVSIVILIYDWFLTVESELAFIWSPKWNLGTLLYFLTRYPAFVDTAILFYISTGYYNTLSPPVRPLLWGVSGWVFLLGIVVAEAIMAICVWAMWGRGRRMAIFLTILVLIVAGVSTIAPAEPPAAAKYISLPNTSFQSIIIAETSRASISLAALTLLQVILFFLVLSKAVQYSRNRCSNFVFGCFQHGLLYYVVLVVLSVTNLAIILTHGPYVISLCIQRTFHAILSARMLLHLRRSAHQTGGVNTSSTSLVSEILFQDGSNSTGDSVSDRGRLSVI